MKIKTSELIDPALDWAVAVSLGGTGLWYDTVGTWWFTLRGGAPSGNKNAAGNKGWQRGDATAKYFTPKLGAEVDVPEGLLK